MIKIKPVTILLLYLVLAESYAQQTSVNGIIAIQNSGYDFGKIEYVQNAEIEEAAEKSRGHATTDADGRFKLITVGIPEKESFRLRVYKTGYQVVNADKLQVVAGQKETVRLYMATHKYIVEARRRYYNTGFENAEKSLSKKLIEKEKELLALQNQSNADLQKADALKSQIAQLQGQYANLDQLATELANKYVAINLDDTDTLYQNAFRLFQSGDLEGALKLWQDANLYGQINSILTEEQRIDSLKNELAIRDSILSLRKLTWLQHLGYGYDSLYQNAPNELFLPVSYKISGTAWYGSNPLPEVEVRTLDGQHTVSDAQGHFELKLPDSFPAPGTKLLFCKPGFNTQTIIVHPEMSGHIKVLMER